MMNSSGENRSDGGGHLRSGTDYALKSEQLKLDAGWLGRVFGSRGNAQTHWTGIIAALVVLLLVCLAFKSNWV